MNGQISMQGGALFLMVVLMVTLLILLVATIIFRAATKWVTKQDISFWISLGIVLLGVIASATTSMLLTIPLTLAGVPENVGELARYIISFCVTSWIYLMILNVFLVRDAPDKYKDVFKINYWKACLIQLIMFLLLGLILVLGLIFYKIGMSLF